MKPREPTLSKNICLWQSFWGDLETVRKRHSAEISHYGQPGSVSSVVAWMIAHQMASDAKADGKMRKRQAGNNPPPPFPG